MFHRKGTFETIAAKQIYIIFIYLLVIFLTSCYGSPFTSCVGKNLQVSKLLEQKSRKPKKEKGTDPKAQRPVDCLFHCSNFDHNFPKKPTDLI